MGTLGFAGAAHAANTIYSSLSTRSGGLMSEQHVLTIDLGTSGPKAAVVSERGRVVGAGLASMIVDVWLKTDFSGGERHDRRICKIADYETKRRS